MAFSYKTPGVYLEEISKLPPSVASVETAIPCFFGVTEKATESIDNDLSGIARKINSMADFELYYGVADIAKAEVLVKLNVPSEAKLSGSYNNNLYYSVKHFFDNGGGPCYIHSVGAFSRSNVDVNTYKNELAKLDLVDEVTILVFPDLAGLNNPLQSYDVYNNALQKASGLKDKFVIIDVVKEGGIDATKTAFRSAISNNLDAIKYGAAYFPNLQTLYSYDFNTAEIKMTFAPDVINVNESAKLLNNLDYKVARNIFSINSVLTFLNPDYFKNISTETHSNKANEILSKRNLLLGYFSDDEQDTLMQNVDTLTAALKAQSDKAVADAKLAKTGAEAALESAKEDAAIAAQDAIDKRAAATADPGDATKEGAADAAEAAALAAEQLVKDATADLETKTNAAAHPVFNFDDTGKELDNVLKQLQTKISAFYTSFGVAIPGVDASTFTTLENTFLKKITPFFNSLFEAKLKQAFLGIPVLLPPSPSIAGVYASVDRSRGVWKAPANVSLNAVKKPEVPLSDLDQEDFNVDAENGKSINCIRQFTGRGNLVWGARTLAGNNNEWRYINVRRFFNMIEESCENASRHFVFEPNDANTWVKVKGMIDNYLTNLWRVGALQGAKPEHAFYVAVGLNQTMTQDDILNGLLIVEIGLAVVRPAEFIILRFSHKLAIS